MKLQKRKKTRLVWRAITILLGSCILSASSCDDPVPPSLDVNPTVINFPKEAGASRDLTITTNSDATWTIYDNECKDWLTISSTEAKGSMTISLTTKDENNKGSLSTELEIVATNDAGSTSKKIRITRDGIPNYDINYAKIAEKMCMSYGMACAIQWGNATSYFLYKIYPANEFVPLRDNDKKIEEEATKSGSTWIRENIPSSGGVEIIYDNCQPGTDYVFVTVPFSSSGERGQITAEDFITKDVNELNQPISSISPYNTFVKETHNGDEGPWYKWDVTGSGNFYITYACASDKLVETMQNHRGAYGDHDYKDGLRVAWNIFMESKKDDLKDFRSVNFNKDNTSGREILCRGSNNATQWINYRETDKYLQIVTWAFKDNDFNSYSGIVYDVVYEVQNGKLIPQPRKDEHPLYVTPTSLDFGYEGGTQSVNVDANEDWSVSVSQTASWCKVTKSAGNDSFTVTVSANSTSRQTKLVVELSSGKNQVEVTVRQQPESSVGRDDYNDDIDIDGGGTPSKTLSISPSSLSMTPAGESKNISVTSNDSWTVSSNQSWCTVSPTSGSNNGSIKVTTAKNTSTSSRTATVTVKGANGVSKTVTVSQDAYTLSVSPSSLQMSSDGESKTVSVTSNDSWTVTSNQSWCTVSPSSGSNNGTVTIKTTANSSSARTATVTIKGSNSGRSVTVSVSQNGGSAIGRDDYGSDKGL